MLFPSIGLMEINTALHRAPSIGCMQGLSQASFFYGVCGKQRTPFDIFPSTRSLS
jgi:hypothetical protein